MADNKSLSAKRKSAVKAPAMVPGMTGIGKKPPQAIELEEAVLGACMLEQMATNAVIDILEPEGVAMSVWPMRRIASSRFSREQLIEVLGRIDPE